MSKRVRPRFGSLQYWPRKRARKTVPRVNWAPVSETNNSFEGLLGVLGYKVGMASAFVKDNGDKSMTKGKRIALPVTILEVPKIKVFSVRFYKNGKVMRDVIVSNDSVLKRKVKLPKSVKELEAVEGFDDIRVVVYPILKNMFKKTPDFVELGISSSDKLNFVKSLIGKEISADSLSKLNLVDVRGLTKGKGRQGPVKRFGITLKAHKSEKGRRNPGSIGPWHPARVTFRAPMAGQVGMFTRIHYNHKVIGFGNVSEDGKNINKESGFKNYGKIQGDYVLISGSVQGPAKRVILVTPAMRPTKRQIRKKMEFIELK